MAKGKVFISIVETDGLKAALESERAIESIIKRLKPYLQTYKIIKLDDFEIKQRPKIYQELVGIITEFLK